MRFALAAEAAETPLSIARAAYWRGRAAEAMGHVEEAGLDYESAASEPIAYYGQLAAERLGAKRFPLRATIRRGGGSDARDDAVRAAEALYATASTNSRRRSRSEPPSNGATRLRWRRWRPW